MFYGGTKMRHALNTFIAVIFGVMMMSSSSSGMDLETYRWKNRLLLVFATTESDPAFADFDRNLSTGAAEVKDRDLIVFRVFEKGPSRVGEKPLSSEAAEKLRRHFSVKLGQFTAILIGKDGGVKMVREHEADLQEIFDVIDSMPMRQQEMREKGEVR
jgi:hypothetical protein